MIRSSDIDRLLNLRAQERRSIEEWCKRNDVAESVIERVVQVYGRDHRSAIAAIDAFRLGHEARRDDEPRGKCTRGGRRYEVQSVVVDTQSGRFVGEASPSKPGVDGLAGTYNELASDGTGRQR